jgi:hypothetical protein
MLTDYVEYNLTIDAETYTRPTLSSVELKEFEEPTDDEKNNKTGTLIYHRELFLLYYNLNNLFNDSNKHDKILNELYKIKEYIEFNIIHTL